MNSDRAQATYRRVAGVDQSQVGERVVLSHELRGKAVILNPSGARLWNRLERPQSIASLAADLCESHPGLDARQAEDDVKDYLAELEQEDVIERDG